MYALYDTPRATGGTRAEHRTWRFTAAGNLDCELHQTTSTARTCSQNYVEIWDQSMTMFYFTPRLGDYRGGGLERVFPLREELLSFTLDVKKQTWLMFCVMKINCLPLPM
jgi:hypothetical protein